MQPEEIECLKKAGAIAKQAVAYAKELIKPDMLLLEIAEQIESKIDELGGKPAFPVNLSIDNIAAHYTPSWNDSSISRGLLKVDIGVQVDGYIADTAFSIDLENSEENKKLIEAAEAALEKASEKIDLDIQFREIGKIIDKTINLRGFQAIRNLSGHSITRYELHSGLTIPNYDNVKEEEIQQGVYAIEPFATNGLGSVRDGRPSGIYHIQKEGNVRDSFAREVLKFILKEYKTLPFCSRWIYKKFGSRSILALSQIEQAGIIHHYPQLIERGSGKVAQAEHTVILTAKEKIITTI
ncbi:MAG: type II methionyl aminopeptidase [Nanoarchaeota archaeon]